MGTVIEAGLLHGLVTAGDATLNQFITALILALSPLTGYAISMFAKEELKPGKKWFVIAKRVLFVISAGIFLFAHKWQVWHMTIGIVVLFAYLAFDTHRRWWLIWTALGAAFALTAQTPLLFLLSTGIFLYGLLAGGVLAGIKKVNGALAAGAVFLAVAGILLHLL